MNQTDILLQAYTRDEWVEPQAEFALVRLTPASARRYLKLVNVARALEAQDLDTFYCIEAFDYSPTWYDWSDHLDELIALFGSGECANLHMAIQVTTANVVSQDCTTVRVKTAGIAWSSHIKGTNARVETATIPVEVLEQVAGVELAADSGRRPATLEEVVDAQACYASDIVQIDDDALASDGEGGTWVGAWVWLPQP